MARKKVAEDGALSPQSEKPKRNYTPSDVLSMKLSKRVTAIVQALAKHYGKKQSEVLETLSATTEGQQIESLKSLQGYYESQSTSAIAGLFEQDTQPADPTPHYEVDEDQVVAV